jgi:transposase, IS5 family
VKGGLRRAEAVRKSAAGRKPWDEVLIFKALVLQALYNQSDDTLEYQLRDRLSFRHFMGLGLEDAVPDAKTLWLDQETLAKAGALEGLFKQFDTYLKAKGYFAMRAVERPRDCRRPEFLSRRACYEQDNYQIFT